MEQVGFTALQYLSNEICVLPEPVDLGLYGCVIPVLHGEPCAQPVPDLQRGIRHCSGRFLRRVTRNCIRRNRFCRQRREGRHHCTQIVQIGRHGAKALHHIRVCELRGQEDGKCGHPECIGYFHGYLPQSAYCLFASPSLASSVRTPAAWQKPCDGDTLYGYRCYSGWRPGESSFRTIRPGFFRESG